MTLTLIDDGTLDTVFYCSDCGEHVRYSAEWRAGFKTPAVQEHMKLVGLPNPEDFEEDFDAMVKEAAEEHEEECEAVPEELVLCQVRLRRRDCETAEIALNNGGTLLAPLYGSFTRHPNNDEDGPFLDWLEACAWDQSKQDLVEWFMNLVKGEDTIAGLREQFEDGEFEDTE